MDRDIFLNRELSWLEFNQRVLEEARSDSAPLLERLKFLSITASNLDEFFMVRVGGLEFLRRRGARKKDPSGMTPVQQLKKITDRVRQMVRDQYSCYIERLDPQLREAGIRRVSAAELSRTQRKYVSSFFENEVFPVVSPMAVDSPDSLPFLTGLELHLAVRMKRKADSDRPGFVIIPIDRGLSRIVTLPSEAEFAYIMLEDLIKDYLPQLLSDADIAEAVAFRITRNADLSVHEDDAADFLSEMQEILSERKRSGCVRLEVESSASRSMLSFLKRALNVRDQSVFGVPHTIDLSEVGSMTFAGGFESLKYEEWQPQPVSELDRSRSIFSELSEKTILLCHPYETFEPVLRFLDEAARDPHVLAIKQTLYRTSSDSPVIASLKRAAEEGKYVTAVVELKARFDEARNIEWAKALEDAGVQVIYGVRGLKTHSKVCIVVRKESSGVVRYMHFGTGNYNEKTAKLYSDISYLTSDEDFGRDASAFFNAVTGYSEPQQLLKLSAAPTGLRERVLELIEGERRRSLQGQPGLIKAKINSLVDPGIIEALCRASQAGVEIKLNVRGICCLKPGIKGKSENISVVSIIDRFLEHSRIFYFHRGGDPRVFISSADWMPRNLDRRIELMVPVEDQGSRNKIVSILETYFEDNVKSWELRSDGTYRRRKAETGEAVVRSQKVLYDEAVESARQAERAGKHFFEPHYSPSSSK